MRALLAVLLGYLVACAPPAPSREATDSSDAPRRARDATEPAGDADRDPDPDPVHVPDTTVALAGTLVTERGVPIAGRAFVAVGHDRERRDGITGPSGELALEGVAAPYDLRVDGSGTTGPIVWLGLTRSDPRIELLEPDGPVNVVRAETVRIGVVAPPCGEDACVVDVVSTSPSGQGSTTWASSPSADGEAVAIVDVDHLWAVSRLPGSERIDVHVLVHDRANRSFSYARLGGLEPRAGELADVGFVRAKALATTPEIVAGAAVASAASEARWTTAVVVEAPGFGGVPGASFFVAAVEASSVRTRLPLIDGATWRVTVSATSSARSDIAWSGARDLPIRGGEAPLVALPASPATVAIGDGRMRWQSSGGALATIDVIDVARGTYRYRLVTNETDFALGRLEAVGLAPLAKGEHEARAGFEPDAAVNETLDPDPAVRRRRLDEHRAGAISYTRASFLVRP